jgi:hypothetical protein
MHDVKVIDYNLDGSTPVTHVERHATQWIYMLVIPFTYPIYVYTSVIYAQPGTSYK